MPLYVAFGFQVMMGGVTLMECVVDNPVTVCHF